MPPELIVLIIALIVSWLVFSALVNLVKTTVKTAIAIAVILFILQLFFGIGPNDLWQKLLELPQAIWHQVTGG